MYIGLCTSPTLHKKPFHIGLELCELRRILLPRTPVNRGKRGPRLLDHGSANYHCILLRAMDDAYPAPYAPRLHPAIGLVWSGNPPDGAFRAELSGWAVGHPAPPQRDRTV